MANTLYVVCVVTRDGGRIGLVTEMRLVYDIVDMVVVEAHQRKGLGKMIMEALLGYIHAHARPTSLICLMANKGVAPFYEKFGFKARDADMPGMIIRK